MNPNRAAPVRTAKSPFAVAPRSRGRSRRSGGWTACGGAQCNLVARERVVELDVVNDSIRVPVEVAHQRFDFAANGWPTVADRHEEPSRPWRRLSRREVQCDKNSARDQTGAPEGWEGPPNALRSGVHVQKSAAHGEACLDARQMLRSISASLSSCLWVRPRHILSCAQAAAFDRPSHSLFCF